MQLDSEEPLVKHLIMEIFIAIHLVPYTLLTKLHFFWFCHNDPQGSQQPDLFLRRQWGGKGRMMIQLLPFRNSGESSIAGPEPGLHMKFG